jgi:hypothetical protein
MTYSILLVARSYQLSSPFYFPGERELHLNNLFFFLKETKRKLHLNRKAF